MGIKNNPSLFQPSGTASSPSSVKLGFFLSQLKVLSSPQKPGFSANIVNVEVPPPSPVLTAQEIHKTQSDVRKGLAIWDLKQDFTLREINLLKLKQNLDQKEQLRS